MRAARTFGLVGIAILATTTAALGADRIVGLVPTNGETMLVKQFQVSAGTTITGMEFENNDASTTFPEVALVRGPLSTIAGGTKVASLTQVAFQSGVVTATWSQSVTASSPGTYYAVIRFPSGPGKEGAGSGPGLGAEDVEVPNGSFVAANASSPLVPARLDLRVNLVTTGGSIGKAGGSTPGDPSNQEPATRDHLAVRTQGGRTPVTIRFGLASPASVVLSVFDVAGHLVHEIARASLAAGTHEREWSEANGSHLAAGVYFVRLEASGRTLTEKVVIAR